MSPGDLVTAATPEIIVFGAACTDGRNRVEELLDSAGALPVTAQSPCTRTIVGRDLLPPCVDGDRVQSILDEGFGSLAIRLRPQFLDHTLTVTGHHNTPQSSV